jgi:hypothetical protein
MSSRKRKHVSTATGSQYSKSQRPREATDNTEPISQASAAANPALFIQVHEADLVHGPQAQHTALSLEAEAFRIEDGPMAWKIGAGLIKWGGPEVGARNDVESASDNDADGDSQIGRQDTNGEAVWVDRYAFSSASDCYLPTSGTSGVSNIANTELMKHSRI